MAIKQTTKSYSEILSESNGKRNAAARLRAASYLHTTRYPAFVNAPGQASIDMMNKSMQRFIVSMRKKLTEMAKQYRVIEEQKLNVLFSKYLVYSADPNIRAMVSAPFDRKLQYLNSIINMPEFTGDFYGPIAEEVASISDQIYSQTTSILGAGQQKIKNLEPAQLDQLLSILTNWYREMEAMSANYGSDDLRDITDEIFFTPMRKLQGLISYVKSLSLGQKRVKNYKQDLLNEVVGFKSWDNKTATLQQAFASVKGSVAGLQRFQSGNWEESQLSDIDRLFGNMNVNNNDVSFTGAKTSNKSGKYSKQQKIDIVWTISTKEITQTLNISATSKFDGNIQIHNGGSIMSYIKRLQDDPLTNSIGQLFETPQFLYYFVNEMFLSNLGSDMGNGFIENFRSVLASSAYLFMGVDLLDTRSNVWKFGDGVDFVFTGNRIVPVSTILSNLAIKLQDVRVELNRKNPSDIISRKMAKIRKAPPGFYNKPVVQAGAEASQSYMQRLTYRIFFSSNLFS